MQLTKSVKNVTILKRRFDLKTMLFTRALAAVANQWATVIGEGAFRRYRGVFEALGHTDILFYRSATLSA